MFQGFFLESFIFNNNNIPIELLTILLPASRWQSNCTAHSFEMSGYFKYNHCPLKSRNTQLLNYENRSGDVLVHSESVVPGITFPKTLPTILSSFIIF
jgi:hypothetical protein